MAKTKMKTVYKVKWKNMGLFIASLIGIIVLSFVVLKVQSVYSDYRHTKDMIEKIKDEVEITNVVDDENTKTIAPDSTLSKFDSYWDYIKLSLLEVDMASLKKINSQAVGYIEIKGTDFSYPVLENNDGYYKNHSFDRSENSYGWIYLDDEMSAAELGTNTIIYGNKVWGQVLSSNLKTVTKDEWSSNDDNYIIKYYTNNYSTLWQIISVYKTSDTDYAKVSFESEEELESYIEEMIGKSEIKFKATARTTDKFLTIATNSKGTNIIVQAKLIKIKEEVQ